MNRFPQPTFLDFEASSLDLVASYPIEVGAAFPDGRIQSWLIKPHVLWQDWSEAAEQVHGITRQSLNEEGINLVSIADRLNSLLPPTVFCDAWTFDSFWLHRLFRAARMKPTFELESIAVLLSSEQMARWQLCREEIIEELGITTHRAANDARILHETWLRVTSV